MGKAFVRIRYTDKKLFVQDHFISVTKALLSLPVFNIKQRKNAFLQLRIGRIAQYEDIKIDTYQLSLDIDFNLFLFLTIKANTIQSERFSFSLDELFDFMNVSKTNRFGYVDKIDESLRKLKVLTVSFKKGPETFICGLLNDAVVNRETKTVDIQVSDKYKNFFIADSNAIYNVLRDKYNELSTEYEKALYLFYTTNNANTLNTYSVELLKVRLQCEDVEDKKFLFNIRKANKALEDKGLIVEFFENKACRKTVSISVNVNKHKPFKNQEYKRSEVSDIEMNGEVKGITEEVKEKKTKLNWGFKRPEAEAIEEEDDDLPF
ncbi:RepB family plasmid replication initiator protein [Stutzerimonas balearica]|uniref:RepB family plasmid replication initiator protein n=1 Tax=Stutzerimonas balearica TaxID=74829 RepID=UPI001BCA1A79|nr:RepB family plasmid replication initiator protein [Stutzerimonas balearica]